MVQPFNTLKKNLKKDTTGFKTIKIAILADNASQLLHQALKGYGIANDLNFDIYEADYNQIEQSVGNPQSGLYGFGAEFVIINKSAEHLLKDFYKKNPFEQTQFAQSIAEELRFYADTISTRTKAKVIFTNFTEIHDRVFGNFSAKTKQSFPYQVKKLNLMMMDLAQEHKSVFICDIASLVVQHGYHQSFDPKLYINGDMVYSLHILPYVAQQLTNIIQSITGSFKKCLVLDLDNTTWGGIIGDDGMEGIQLGYFGIGKAFTELQLWVKQLKQRGIIIAVCSKNTEHIALEPFEKHPDMVLRKDDIAVFVANWETKVDNIAHIQSILNIGYDSMVFLDDNPFEREMLKSAIPALTVPDLPEDPAEYVTYLRELNLFETASFTEEDAERTKQYQEEAKRNVLKRSFENEDEFLESLEMCSDVQPFNDFSIPRVAQLSQRSNQFNLRTVRYTENDIKDLLGSAGQHTLSLTLEDKYGDHGIIGLIILKKDAGAFFIDTWIMSCRVLKRGMENFTLNTIVALAKAQGIGKIIGEYLPTAKNGIVKDHYQNLGFTHIDDKWVLDCDTFADRKTFIKTKK